MEQKGREQVHSLPPSLPSPPSSLCPLPSAIGTVLASQAFRLRELHQLFGPGLNYTVSFPGSRACKWNITAELGLRNCLSQFP